MSEVLPVDRDEDGGLVGRLGRFLLGRSWRVSLASYAAALLTAEPTISSVLDGSMPIKKAVPAILGSFFIAVLGRLAKDDRVTGGAP